MPALNLVKKDTAVFVALLLMVCSLGVPAVSSASVFGTFAGTSPGGSSIRQLLRIPPDADLEVIQWNLILHQDEKTRRPSNYELRCDYGLTAPGQPGLARGVKTLERRGVWTRSQGNGIVFELRGALWLRQVDDNVLHVLNPDHSLMVGDGGWSYSLNRAEPAEKLVDPALSRSEPFMSYQIQALASGPAVAGVFEGRSPCHGIASQLQITVPAACLKAKWRITLFRNPATLAATSYRIEGTFFRSGAVEGSWASIQRSQNGASVYRLTRSNGPPLYLLKGDDNVLFFLNRDQQPMVGNVYFSYTLNRRTSPAPS